MSTNTSLLARMAGLFAAQARVYCLSVLIAGVLGIASVTAVSLASYPAASPESFDAVALWRSMGVSGQLVFIFGLVFGFWTPVLIAARGVSRITTNQISGLPVSLPLVLADMLRFIPAALVYSLVIGIPAMIGSSLLFLPGIVVVSLFALVVPTSVNEPGGIFATLRRGYSLGGKVFGRVLLLTLASCALMVMVVALRIYGLDQFLPRAGLALFATRFGVAYIPALLVLVLANICFTLLYLEARKAETPVSPSPTASSAAGN